MNPITTRAEADSAIDDLTAIMDRLSGLLAQETALVHAGRVRKAAEIAPAKTELAGRLYSCSERIKANAKSLLQLAPARCAALKDVQEEFHVLLKRNMTVLATAHAVSEGIVRRLSGELAKKSSPQVYGASGRAVAPNPRHGRPLAVSRTL